MIIGFSRVLDGERSGEFSLSIVCSEPFKWGLRRVCQSLFPLPVALSIFYSFYTSSGVCSMAKLVWGRGLLSQKGNWSTVSSPDKERCGWFYWRSYVWLIYLHFPKIAIVVIPHDFLSPAILISCFFPSFQTKHPNRCWNKGSSSSLIHWNSEMVSICPQRRCTHFWSFDSPKLKCLSTIIYEICKDIISNQ